MPQRFGLYEDLSVEENLRLYADLRGLPVAQRPGVFRELLEFTDLSPFTRRLAGKLSGGMKQKLGLACALLRKPRLLLLDEPSVGVDPISRRELWSMVERLADEGVGVVWSTAYLDEAQACGHVLLLSQGELLYCGAPTEFTGRVAGRVFKITGIAGPARPKLVTALDQPGIRDGVIQGQAIRLVTSADYRPGPEMDRLFGPAARIIPTSPRFEDAFIDFLGGCPRGRSRLAQAATARPAASDQPVIEARGLTKRFGDFTAARDIHLNIPRGQIFGLLGPNGAGKSTTFKMLCGLLRPTEGDGRVAGYDLRRKSAQARNRLGYMAQKFSLYGDLTIRQNLDFFAGVYGLAGSRKRQRVALLSDIFSFHSYERMPSKELPLGIKQRLALACAVMHEPEALFLDEPTSGVDPITRREFWAHIHGLVEKGVTVLVTTHFMDEAEYCDRISLIYRGRSIAMGTPDELKASIAGPSLPDPTLEDAFIALVRRFQTEVDG
jgi:ABC-2 type transport system ATP-binding protein